MCVTLDEEWPLTTNPDGWRPLRVRYSGTAMFEGWWRVQDRLVRTIVSNRPLRTPVRLSTNTPIAALIETYS